MHNAKIYSDNFLRKKIVIQYFLFWTHVYHFHSLSGAVSFKNFNCLKFNTIIYCSAQMEFAICGTLKDCHYDRNITM